MIATDALMTLRKLPQPGRRYGYCDSAYADAGERCGIALAQMPYGERTVGIVLMDDGKVEAVDLVVTEGVGWKLANPENKRTLVSDKLPSPGSRIGYVDADVTLPGEQAGTVIAHVPHYSGSHLLALVLMDNGRTAYADRVIELHAEYPCYGLGWYRV